MRHKPGYNTDQHDAFILLEPHALLKLNLVDLFFLDGVQSIILVECRVALRVIADRVDPIQDADQFPLMVAEQTVQTMREPRIGDLIGIGRADGRNIVADLDRRFHHVQASIIHHGRCGIVRQAEHIGCDLHAIFALILDVVNRKDRSDLLIFFDLAVEQVQINRHHRSLPVVAVEDVWIIVNILNHLANRFGEKRKPLCIIIETVDASVAFKIILIIQ